MDFSLGHVDFDCTWSNPAISLAAFIACAFAASLTWRIVRSQRSILVRFAQAVVTVIVGEMLFSLAADLGMRVELLTEDAPSFGDRFRHATAPSTIGCMTTDPWRSSPSLAIVVVAGIAVLVAWKWPRR